MNTLWVLLKADLLNTFNVNRLLGKHSKSKTKSVLALIGVILLTLIIEAYAFSMAFGIGIVAKQLDALFVLVGGIFIVEALWSLLSSIRLSSTYLFKFKDFDLLMSMPINPTIILTEKIIKFYFSNLISSFILCFPFLTVYGILNGSAIGYYLLAFVLILFVPMISTILGAIVSFPILFVASKFNKIDLVNTIFTFIISIGIMIGSMSMSTFGSSMATNDINLNIDVDIIWGYIGKYPPAIWFTQGLVNYDFISVCMFLGTNLLLFSLFIVLFKKLFTKINSSLNESAGATKKYKFTDQKSSSTFASLTNIEIKNYFSSYLYLINTAMGAIMCVFFSIVIIIKGSDLLAQFPFLVSGEYSSVIMIALALMLTLFITVNPTTSSTISLEGKKVWIIKTLPCKIESIFLSKSTVNWIINIPALIISNIILTIYFKLSFIDSIFLFLIPFAALVLTTFTGLLVNLAFPKMNWSTQQQVIKNSMSVFISMLISFLFEIIIGAFCLFAIIIPLLSKSDAATTAVYMLLSLLVFLMVVLIAALWILLKTKGEKMLLKIEY